MFLDELEREAERGAFAPVYLLVGPEEHLRRRALGVLRKKAVAAEALAFNFAAFDARAGSMREVVAAANTFPLASRRRLVVVEGLEGLAAAEAAILEEYVRAPQAKTVLALSAEDLDRRTGLYRTLAEKAVVVEFPKLKAHELESWAGEHLRRAGVRVSSGSLRKLVDLAGADLQSVANEVDKLLLYSAGEKTVTDATVDSLVRGSRQHGIFELTRAIGRRDRPQALRVLGNLIEAGEHPLMIVTMLARHFRQVLIARELARDGRSAAEIGSAAQIPAFLRTEFISQARALAPGFAEAMFTRLAETDLRIKSSNVDERMLLERVIVSL